MIALAMALGVARLRTAVKFEVASLLGEVPTSNKHRGHDCESKIVLGRALTNASRGTNRKTFARSEPYRF